MLEQIERVRRVIDDYQRLANVEPRQTRASINDVVRRVLALQSFAAVPGISVRSVLDEDLPECDIDRELIETLLENVLRNAFEAMPEGGTVTVRTELASDDGALLVTVEDTGRGMDVRELERATDEFFTTKPTGTGLGLNYAARVAAAHGGSLELGSAVGAGTSVRLRLPHGIRS
jgi:signal transduction histidine kinase